MPAPLIRHLEECLGEIQEGWTANADGVQMPFQVVRLSGTHGHGSKRYFSTLGLSNHVLRSRKTGKEIHCELVMVAQNGSDSIPGILQQVGQELIESGRALLRGDVIGPRDSLVNGSAMVAIYASIPVYFPPALASCKLDGVGTVVFIWLVPIAANEARFIAESGWEAFENLLEKENPTLADLRRDSVIQD